MKMIRERGDGLVRSEEAGCNGTMRREWRSNGTARCRSPIPCHQQSTDVILPMSDNKVLNMFQMRRQMAEAFQAMDGAANEMALIDLAHEIVDTFPTELVLNTLVKQLDTESSQLRGGLGHIATFLPARSDSRRIAFCCC